MNEPSTRVILTVSLVVCCVGAVDAAISAEWDLLAIFVLTSLVQATLLVRWMVNRVPVSLRPDLARWVEQRSERSGEPIDDIVDRAVAWYQHGLYRTDRTDA